MKKIIIAAVLSMFAMGANASLITTGFTFAVASGSDNSVGNHYHSSTGGDFGNPSGKAEVGSFFDEEVRGLSEYDIFGLSTSSSAFVTFNVFTLGGLFSGVNDFPFSGTIDVVAYLGNNAEDLADYQAPVLQMLGSFSTAALFVGETISFDVTSVFNSLVNQSAQSLGIRLQIASGTSTGGGAFVFDTFRLTTDDQSSTPRNVSEPTSVALLGLALIAAGFRRRNR